jgi:hypothetical protein
VNTTPTAEVTAIDYAALTSTEQATVNAYRYRVDGADLETIEAMRDCWWDAFVALGADAPVVGVRTYEVRDGFTWNEIVTVGLPADFTGRVLGNLWHRAMFKGQRVDAMAHTVEAVYGRDSFE